MRIFQLSDAILKDVHRVYRYLNYDLSKENNSYVYEKGSGKVASDSVKVEDLILFSFKHDIVGSGVLSSGRLSSAKEGYSYMFRFKEGSIKTFPLGLNLNELHECLTSNGVDVGKPFVQRQDWPMIDNKDAPLVIRWLKNQVFKYYDDLNLNNINK